MRDMLKLIAVFAAVFLVTYAVGAIYFWDINPTHWGKARSLLVMVPVAITFFALFF